ncbi:hypothetical protein AS591_16705 [Stenotrophomonas maltophilia]|nr:hypothetical protein AS591_16705 [Stenotrophomonas maltophilia]
MTALGTVKPCLAAFCFLLLLFLFLALQLRPEPSVGSALHRPRTQETVESLRVGPGRTVRGMHAADGPARTHPQALNGFLRARPM